MGLFWTRVFQKCGCFECLFAIESHYLRNIAHRILHVQRFHKHCKRAPFKQASFSKAPYVSRALLQRNIAQRTVTLTTVLEIKEPCHWRPFPETPMCTGFF